MHKRQQNEKFSNNIKDLDRHGDINSYISLKHVIRGAGGDKLGVAIGSAHQND
jgi:hypothetical protein